MKKLLIYYNFILVSVLVLWGFLDAQNQTQLITGIIAFPLFSYFAIQVIPKRQKTLSIAKITKKEKALETSGTDQEEEVVLTKIEEPKKGRLDVDRRLFLKLVGSAGISLFLFTIFTRRAEAAFFGSNPGPGTVGIKDSAGALIDPAEKQPTDGYVISQIDDASSPAYYGFINKVGAWYIMKENTDGSYTYVAGTSNFSINWATHGTRSDYTTFDAAF